MNPRPAFAGSRWTAVLRSRATQPEASAAGEMHSSSTPRLFQPLIHFQRDDVPRLDDPLIQPHPHPRRLQPLRLPLRHIGSPWFRFRDAE